MDLETYVALHGATLGQVIEEAKAVIPFGAGDRLVAVGSLAEGLGNRKSDVDLLLVTPDCRKADISPEQIHPIVVGQCVVDLRVVPTPFVEALRARLRHWAQGDWAVALPVDFSAGELLMLHRISAGRLLWPGIDPSTDDTAGLRDDVARLKLHVARHMARTIQVDMSGYREAGDPVSLVYAAQELLGHAVDGLLAGFRLTNPTPKWRSRLLDQLPSDWENHLVIRPTGLSAREVMWNLHRAPAEASDDAALGHACRIATFARAVFHWAEDTLVHCGASRRYVWPKKTASVKAAALPFLQLDVDVMRIGGGVAMGRLNEQGDMLRLEFDGAAVFLLFDNATTAPEAASVIRSELRGMPASAIYQLARELHRFGFTVAA